MLIFQTLLILLIVFVAPVLTFLLTKKKKDEEESGRIVPPGPKRLPVIGNLHQLRHPPHESLHKLSKEYGSLMFLQLGSIPTVVISSADMAKEVFKNHDLVFSSRPALYSAKRVSYDFSNISFASYGEYWRELRKIVTLELLSAKRVQSFQTVREEEVALMADFVAESSNCVNLSDLFLSLANNIICRVAFGQKQGGKSVHDKNTFHELLRELDDFLGGFSIADFFPWLEWINNFNGLGARYDKNFRELDKFYDRIIEEHSDPRQPNDEHEDIVDVLLRIQKDPNRSISLTNNQIKAAINDIFVAGTDTSSSTLTWIMAELIKNPPAMKKAQDEIRGIMKGKTKVEERDLTKLEYIKLVIKEGFRLHPPLPLLVPRETIENCNVDGYHIPAKTRVFVNAKAIGTDPKYWENPEEFTPERFCDISVDYRGQHHELIPFGVGRRSCPGMNFATQVIELALATLLLRFDWRLPDGQILDMDESFGLIVNKKVPLCLVAKLVA